MSGLELSEARRIAEKWTAIGRIGFRKSEPVQTGSKPDGEYSKTTSAIAQRRRRERYKRMGLTTLGTPFKRSPNKPKI